MTDAELIPKDSLNAASLTGRERPRFSICSIVNRRSQYAEMRQSFEAGGFTAEAGCEYLYLDNTDQNLYEPYSGYNLFLREARGEYVILCHQDVFLIKDGIDRLNEVIAELNNTDPAWGLFGNSGGYWPCSNAIRISDKAGNDQARGGPFPRKCHSLDENFILVRADANLALSRDLSGYHLYGTEICLVAEALGYQSYVVDFFLHHAGEAKMDHTYELIRAAMIRKYSARLAFRYIRSPCSTMVFSPWSPITWFANTSIGLKLSCLFSSVFGKPTGSGSAKTVSGT